jgi:hypothetical protein
MARAGCRMPAAQWREPAVEAAGAGRRIPSWLLVARVDVADRL